MTAPAPDADDARQTLSDLVDGRLDGAALRQACDNWAADAEMRRSWHAYQLIGDVMRSDDLVGRPQRDAAFLAAVRERLAREPVVLAPTQPAAALAVAPTAGRPHRVARQIWWPMTAAAGFVAVAGVLVVLGQGGVSPDEAALLAARQAAPAVVLPVAAQVARQDVNQGANAGQVPVTQATLVSSSPPVNAQMLRDARVDDYLRAHRETLAGSPAALPGGGLRSVDFTVPQR